MKLNPTLLHSEELLNRGDVYNNCYNALGVYEPMRFVLRLRRDVHLKLNKVPIGIHSTSEVDDDDATQAFSTYFHETIHWWQHVGSIAGLVFSFCTPAQAHSNYNYLKKFISLSGLIKPIVKYNFSLYGNNLEDTEELRIQNTILNNFYDIEFFRYLVYKPALISSQVKNPFFESVGHSYYITYSEFISLLSIFDNKLGYLPNPENWAKSYAILRNERRVGYYYGSPISIPPLGLEEIYEGQARFCQLQFLYLASGCSLSWLNFEEMGMLDGVYYKAFQLFLDLTDSERPDTVSSPLVGLFLLILDIAMNPTEGFPFEIIDYESFITSVDPGFRFIFLCRTIALDEPNLKDYIKNYTNDEYKYVSKILCDKIVCPSPLEAAELIAYWAETKEELVELMSEEKNFKFKDTNQPIRLIFSRFIRYQQDKLKAPAFFCWPGIYLAGNYCDDDSLNLFQEHEALFCDQEDGDIYPRTFKDKNNDEVQKSFDTFYGWLSVYELTKQWIIQEDEFNYDFFWLSSKHSRNELTMWATRHFKSTYGVDPNSFTVIE